MSLQTELLKLFQYEESDGSKTFNLDKALNENWKKIDDYLQGVLLSDMSNVTAENLINAIKASGALNRKADLGDDGKVLRSQIPPLDYDAKGSAAATLTSAKAYADALAPTFIYKCTGNADSTAIEKIVNDFFTNGTAMNMKLIITGTMGVASSYFPLLYIKTTNPRGARVFLDFSDCYIPENKIATLLSINGAANVHVAGLVGTTSGYGIYCAGTGNNIFFNCSVLGGSESECGAGVLGTGSNTFIGCSLHGKFGVLVNSKGSCSTFLNCKLTGTTYGVYGSTADTSTVVKLTDCLIKGTQDVYQHTPASTMHWLIKGCSFSQSSIYVNGKYVSANTTVANEYLAIQAYHNLFSQMIE